MTKMLAKGWYQFLQQTYTICIDGITFFCCLQLSSPCACCLYVYLCPQCALHEHQSAEWKTDQQLTLTQWSDALLIAMLIPWQVTDGWMLLACCQLVQSWSLKLTLSTSWPAVLQMILIFQNVTLPPTSKLTVSWR